MQCLKVIIKEIEKIKKSFDNYITCQAPQNKIKKSKEDYGAQAQIKINFVNPKGEVMSRYINKIEFRNPETFRKNVEDFLKAKSFILVNRQNENTWIKNGFNCKHCVIIIYEEMAIQISAFIIYHNFELKYGGTMWVESKAETESTCKGFSGGFGKWPLQKIVRQLEKLIIENAK